MHWRESEDGLTARCDEVYGSAQVWYESREHVFYWRVRGFMPGARPDQACTVASGIEDSYGAAHARCSELLTNLSREWSALMSDAHGHPPVPRVAQYWRFGSPGNYVFETVVKVEEGHGWFCHDMSPRFAEGMPDWLARGYWRDRVWPPQRAVLVAGPGAPWAPSEEA